MTSFSQVLTTLRRKNHGQYLLLTACCFFSVLLITAYSCIMRAPTILSTLPEGGDSRKQAMMVFVLAVIGCAVFTTYAAGLFFRYKSREVGIFLALGASRARLRRTLIQELLWISSIGCISGATLGGPLAWCIWQIFRKLLVDTEEMRLIFDPKAYLISVAFCIFVFCMLFVMLARFIQRANIVDIIQQQHKSEPIHQVPPWYGITGIALIFIGLFLGYQFPGFCVRQLHWYAPEWLSAVFYLPTLVGLYWILLHTVVNGWHHKKHIYAHLISTSMMKFQGRQTVRNMLIMTLLLAGAYFAVFYIPMLGVGAMMQYSARPTDYMFHYRADQDMPTKQEIEQMAKQEQVIITRFAEMPVAVLGIDGNTQEETTNAWGTTYEVVYYDILQTNNFLSESAYTALTDQEVDVLSSQIAAVFDVDGNSNGEFYPEVSQVTNVLTGNALSVTPAEQILCNETLFGYYVLDDEDYATITQGLTPEWSEKIVCFNVSDVKNSYNFAKRLFNEIVDRSGPEVEVFDAYDPIVKARSEQAGKPYVFANENLAQFNFSPIDYSERDSSNFRLYWKYMPQFRVLDQQDFMKTMAVYLMLFLFISLVCFAAIIIIGFTRCLTIALSHVQIFEDLRKLGAPASYLYQTAREQVSRVFLVPSIVGTTLIYLFYMMILYFNGDPVGFTSGEIGGLLTCAGILVILSLVLYLVYRMTLHRVCMLLSLHRTKTKS